MSNINQTITNFMYEIQTAYLPSLDFDSEGLQTDYRSNQIFEKVLVEFKRINEYAIEVDFNVDMAYECDEGDYWTAPSELYQADFYLDSMTVVYNDYNNTRKKIDNKSPLYWQVKKQLENYYEV